MWREVVVIVCAGGVGLGALLCRWSLPEVPASAMPGAHPRARLEIPPVPDYVAHPIVDPAERDNGPRRIISTSPQLTELCCALGLLDRLVGRSRYCRYPPAVRSIPSVGALIDLNLEQCMRLQAELILVSGRSELIRQRLDSVGLRYVRLPDRSLADIYQAIERLGTLVDRPRTARALVGRIRQDLMGLSRYRATRPLRVLMVTGKMNVPPRAPWVAGPGSYLDSLLRLAGHENAAADLARPYGQVSLEYVACTDPDAIVEFRPEERISPRDEERAYVAWSMVGRLSAVRNGRVYVLGGQVHLVPGPRVAETLRQIMLVLGG